MEVENSTIFENSDDLVRNLKKKFRCFKRQIKENTSKCQRFPIVIIDKCLPLDQYSIDVKQNGFNDSNDRKITQISRKIDPTFDIQPNKKRKTEDSIVNLSKINNENEELDYEMSDEENNDIFFDTNNGNNKNLNHLHSNKNRNNFTKLKISSNKTEISKKLESNNHKLNNKSSKQDLCNGLSFYNNSNDLNYKIPKKESIESLIKFANDLIKHNKRCGDAFTYLCRHLSEEQWNNTDITEIVAKIALGIASNNDLGSHFSRFEDVMNKIKSLKYSNDDFWDQLIFRVKMKKNDIKYAHQINSFLAGLYEYLSENKISCRVLCNEAVIIAFRSFSSNQQISL